MKRVFTLLFFYFTLLLLGGSLSCAFASSTLVMLHSDFSLPIHIVHIGDSHLQSGYLGEALRKELAKTYQLQGYGLIAPYILTGSNAPTAYKYRSTSKWSSCTLSYTHSCIPSSPCGIVLSKKGGSSFDFTLSSSAYPFDKVIIYRGEYSPSLHPQKVKYTLQEGKISFAGMVADTLSFETPLRKVVLKPLSIPKNKVYYGGALLLNIHQKQQSSKSPLLYSQIGLNGAMYANFTRKEFIESLSSLAPQYILISLGTNESRAPRFGRKAFKKQVESLLDMIQRRLPNTQIILSTPAPNFRGGKLNLSSIYAKEVIEEVTSQRNIPLINLYDALEGKEGVKELRNKGTYYSRDGIHYTIDGYYHQGKFMAQQLLLLIH